MTEPATIRMVGERLMQCKDIPDDEFLAAVLRAPGYGGEPVEPHRWRSRYKVQAELEKVVGPIPRKLFLAKAQNLGRRGLLGGCTNCSCRGDYHIAAVCREIRNSCCSVTLKATDEEPPDGTTVRDDCGVKWTRASDPGSGYAYWFQPDHPEYDTESWMKIAGNYGPVVVLEWGDDDA